MTRILDQMVDEYLKREAEAREAAVKALRNILS
jgi:hypothetical protein